MFKPLWWLVCGCLAALPCAAQPFDFPAAAVEDPAALAKSMPALAREVIAVYRNDDRRQSLDDLFRLQTVAGRYADAAKTLAALRALPPDSVSPQGRATRVLYEIFARARQSEGEPFDAAFRRAFREALGRLDDRTAALVMRALGADPSAIRQTLNEALEPQKGKSSISLAGAVTLIRAYQVEQAFESFTPLAAPLIAEDDRRRYIIDKAIPVRTA